MKSFFSKNKKKIIAISSIFLFASLFFLYPSVASAEDGENVAKVLGWIIFPFIWIMGQLATLLLGILIKIAQYNDFINSSAVSYGWVVVRDLCNMFFVLILLIIAFASILRVDSYNLKTWLPKLVIMAVLINFSKLICGIFIDFAQVVMLTFVNAFKDIAGANLTDMLGITKILDFNSKSSPEVTAWTIIGSMVLALVVSVIAVVVILSMLAMLAMRIVLIWIYVVLSPIAYLMAAFPQGQSNSQRWWSDFSKNVIVGPILAFFIWLAFASLGGVEGEEQIKKIQAGKEIKSGFENNETDQASQVLTEAGSPDNLIKMIISIGMLLGGLMLAQEMGDRSGKIAGKGLAKLQTMGAGALKRGKNAAAFVGKRTAEAGLGVAGAAVGGKDTSAGRFLKGWSGDMKTTRVKKAVKARQDFMESMGMGEKAGVAGKELTGKIKTALNVGDRRGNKKIEEGSEKIKEGNKDKSLAENLEISQNNFDRFDSQSQVMKNIEDGNKSVEDGKNKIAEGEQDLKKSKDLKKAQDKYDNLDQQVSSLSSQGLMGTPQFIAAVGSKNEAESDLKEARAKAGISENSTKQETLAAVNQLKTDGQNKITDGETSVNDGKNKINSNSGLVDSELKKMGVSTFADMDELRVKSEGDLKKYRKEAGISEDATRQETLDTANSLRINGQKKIDTGTNLVDTGNKQKGGYGKFGTFLIGHTNKAFAKMSEDYEKADNFTEALAKDDPVFSDVDGGKFSKLDSSIGTEQKAVWDNLNSNKHAGAATKLKNLTENALFDSTGNAKTLKDADKAKVNSMARGLKTYESSGAKLSPELTALKKLINDYAAKSGGAIKSVDERKAGSYRISGVDKPSNNMDVNESGIGSINEFGRNRGKSDTISYNFDKLAAKGLNVDTMAEGVHLEGDIKDKVKVEIISDIDKELNDLKAKVSGGQEASVKDSNRMKILETAKSRLEAGDDFSLVNANKKMGLTEAVITQRHEGAHAKLDEMRKTENFTQTQEQEKQEEELVEFYGNRARDAKVTHQVADIVVADVIFEGQKRGLSTDEIKVNISEITDEYKAGRQKTPNKIEEVRENIQVNNIIKNEAETIKEGSIDNNSSFFMPDISENFNELGGSIKDSFSSVKGSVDELKKTSSSIKTAQSIQERIDLYRFQQLKKNKK